MEKISILNNKNQSTSVDIDFEPSECPSCHSFIKPELKIGCLDFDTEADFFRTQVVFLCPRPACARLFIAIYGDGPNFHMDQIFTLSAVVPLEPNDHKFSDAIKNISDNFCKIYNHAFTAEQHSLTEISGVGYRKALEFLVKDYIIAQYPNKEEIIKKTDISKCIKDYIESKMIKEIAERAVWLGNDETHYLRKWLEKDVNDLKKLINMVVNLFEMEHSHQEILIDMPEGKNKEK